MPFFFFFFYSAWILISQEGDENSKQKHRKEGEINSLRLFHFHTCAHTYTHTHTHLLHTHTRTNFNPRAVLVLEPFVAFAVNWAQIAQIIKSPAWGTAQLSCASQPSPSPSPPQSPRFLPHVLSTRVTADHKVGTVVTSGG